MSAITSLRNALEGVTDEAEDRIIGVLQATEGIALGFISAVFDAVEGLARQVVAVFFDLAQTVVIGGFNVVDSVISVALGVATDESVDAPFSSVIENDEEGSN